LIFTNASSKCQRHWMKPRMCAARLLRISAANNWAKPIPPEPDDFVADVDPALGQEIFDVAQRQWVYHVHHHYQTDDLRRAVKYRNGLLMA
jgi:hypothetical protein